MAMASNLLLRRVAPSLAAGVVPRRPPPPTATVAAAAVDASSSIRSYVTRAHAAPTPTVPIHTAVRDVLVEMDARHARRLERWESNKNDRVEQRVAYLLERGRPGAPTPDAVREDASSAPYRRMDETVELALQLNLDPRKPGQSLRGSMKLPHGNGRSFGVAVFTDDPDLARRATEAGAVAAGGASLVESIKDGTTPLSSFQRTLATSEMTSQLSSVARILGPRGLMPNPKIGTIVPREGLLDALALQMSGVSNYRTDKEGIVRLGVGRGSFGMEKILDNVREIMNEIHGVKPESFGKGKKGQKGKVAKGTKYYLKAHLSATQGRGSVLVDIRTIDPTSAFFMSEIQ